MTPLPPPPEFVALFPKYRRFALAVHKGPDGDALGAALGLYWALTRAGKEAQLLTPTPLPRHYLWLPGIERFTNAVAEPPEVALLIDSEGWERIGGLAEALRQAPVWARLDHHQTAPAEEELAYVDPDAASTAQLVYRLLCALEWPITPTIALCLYTGLATDTGFFRFENTGATALAEAAALAAAGAPVAEIAERAGERRSLARTRLLGCALQGAQFDNSGRIVWAVLRPEDFQRAGATAEDTEGIVDILKQVEGQQAVVLFKAPERADRWQISLRARGIDVAAIARQWGGGGHTAAAGCEAEGHLEKIRPALLRALNTALDTAGAKPQRPGTPQQMFAE